MELSYEDLKRLGDLARLAAPGPWKYEGKNYSDSGCSYYSVSDATRDDVVGLYGPISEDAEFIAAANPEVILELLSRLEQAELLLDEWRERG